MERGADASVLGPCGEVPDAAEEPPLPLSQVLAVLARHLAEHKQRPIETLGESNSGVGRHTLRGCLVLIRPILDQSQCGQLEVIGLERTA